MSLSFCFELPKILLVAILSQWCSVRQLMLFDSCVCNHDDRAQLTICFKAPAFCMATCGLGSEFFWIERKAIKVLALDVIDFYFANRTNQRLQKEKIESLSVLNISSVFSDQTDCLVEFINACSQLHTLKFNGLCLVNDRTIFGITQNSWRKYIKLEIYNFINLSVTALEYITTYATGLQHILLHSCAECKDRKKIVPFLNSCPTVDCLIFRLKSTDYAIYSRKNSTRILWLTESFYGHNSLLANLACWTDEFSKLICVGISDTNMIIEALLYRRSFDPKRMTYLNSITFDSCIMNGNNHYFKVLIRSFDNLKYFKFVDGLCWSYDGSIDQNWKEKHYNYIVELVNLQSLSPTILLNCIDNYPIIEFNLADKFSTIIE